MKTKTRNKLIVILLIINTLTLGLSGYLLYKTNYMYQLLKDMAILSLYNNKDYQNNLKNDNNDPNGVGGMNQSDNDEPKEFDPMEDINKHKVYHL